MPFIMVNRRRLRSGEFRYPPRGPYSAAAPWLRRLTRGVLPHVARFGSIALKRYFDSRRSGKSDKRPVRFRAGTARRGVTQPQNFNTYGGSYKKFRSTKKKIPANKYKKLGSTLKTERGGLVTPAEIGVVGHSNCAPREIVKSVARAIWRACMLKHGIVFSDWTDVYDTPVASFQIFLEYRNRAEDVISGITGSAYVATRTHYVWAEELADMMFRAAVAGVDGLILNKLTFFNPADSSRICELDLTNMTIHFKMESVMVVQNRTKGAASTDDLSTDVTNNPVIGRAWAITGNEVCSLFNNAVSTRSYAHEDSGLLLGSVNVSDPVFVPRHYAINEAQSYRYCTGSSRQKIMPGGIKKSFLTNTYKMSLNNWCHLFRNYFKQNTSLGTASDLMRIPFGKSRLFSFDKLCDTGAGDQLVALGYEIQNTYSCYVSNRLPYANLLAVRHS